jgi:hypothetical protein
MSGTTPERPRTPDVERLIDALCNPTLKKYFSPKTREVVIRLDGNELGRIAESLPEEKYRESEREIWRTYLEGR